VDGGSYLLAMLVIAWLVAFALAIVYLLAFDKLAQLPINWWLLLASFSASWALMSIIASSVLAKDIGDIKVILCLMDMLDGYTIELNCRLLKGPRPQRCLQVRLTPLCSSK
jgi:hypothetical protein